MWRPIVGHSLSMFATEVLVRKAIIDPFSPGSAVHPLTKEPLCHASTIVHERLIQILREGYSALGEYYPPADVDQRVPDLLMAMKHYYMSDVIDLVEEEDAERPYLSREQLKHRIERCTATLLMDLLVFPQAEYRNAVVMGILRALENKAATMDAITLVVSEILDFLEYYEACKSLDLLKPIIRQMVTLRPVSLLSALKQAGPYKSVFFINYVHFLCLEIPALDRPSKNLERYWDTVMLLPGLYCPHANWLHYAILAQMENNVNIVAPVLKELLDDSSPSADSLLNVLKQKRAARRILFDMQFFQRFPGFMAVNMAHVQDDDLTSAYISAVLSSLFESRDFMHAYFEFLPRCSREQREEWLQLIDKSSPDTRLLVLESFMQHALLIEEGGASSNSGGENNDNKRKLPASPLDDDNLKLMMLCLM